MVISSEIISDTKSDAQQNDFYEKWFHRRRDARKTETVMVWKILHHFRLIWTWLWIGKRPGMRVGRELTSEKMFKRKSSLLICISDFCQNMRLTRVLHARATLFLLTKMFLFNNCVSEFGCSTVPSARGTKVTTAETPLNKSIKTTVEYKHSGVQEKGTWAVMLSLFLSCTLSFITIIYIIRL